MSRKDLDMLVTELRQMLKQLARPQVKTEADRKKLAKKIGRSESQIRAFLYEGKGGFDTIFKVIGAVHNVDLNFLRSLKGSLRKMKPVDDADSIWFSIRDELGLPQEEIHYLARCAYEAARIRTDIDKIKGKKPKK